MRTRLLALALGTILLQGCPPGTPIPVPPFDASGTFAGTWSGTPNGDGSQPVDECPLELTLTQNIAAQWPATFVVNGTVNVDYACFNLPEWLETPPPSTVNVGGMMNEQGKLTLLSAACGTGACVALALDGTGVDTDDDGTMDAYDGTWTYTIALAGVQPFGFTGTYTTDRAED